MRPQIIKILPVLLFIFNSVSMLSQEAEPPAPSTNNRGPEFPIDNSIVILLAIGLAYGIYIAYKKHQAKNTPA